MPHHVFISAKQIWNKKSIPRRESNPFSVFHLPPSPSFRAFSDSVRLASVCQSFIRASNIRFRIPSHQILVSYTDSNRQLAAQNDDLKCQLADAHLSVPLPPSLPLPLSSVLSFSGSLSATWRHVSLCRPAHSMRNCHVALSHLATKPNFAPAGSRRMGASNFWSLMPPGGVMLTAVVCRVGRQCAVPPCRRG